jgi:hypothetical protein
MKFVIDTKYYGLKIIIGIFNNMVWEVIVFLNSDWSGDKDD